MEPPGRVPGASHMQALGSSGAVRGPWQDLCQKPCLNDCEITTGKSSLNTEVSWKGESRWPSLAGEAHLWMVDHLGTFHQERIVHLWCM